MNCGEVSDTSKPTFYLSDKESFDNENVQSSLDRSIEHKEVNLGMVMQQLGISDLSNTYRYLKPYIGDREDEIRNLEQLYPFRD